MIIYVTSTTTKGKGGFLRAVNGGRVKDGELVEDNSCLVRAAIRVPRCSGLIRAHCCLLFPVLEKETP
jgi:hypothetical protein